MSAFLKYNSDYRFTAANILNTDLGTDGDMYDDRTFTICPEHERWHEDSLSEIRTRNVA
jgi:hypothetical protein